MENDDEQVKVFFFPVQWFSQAEAAKPLITKFVVHKFSGSDIQGGVLGAQASLTLPPPPDPLERCISEGCTTLFKAILTTVRSEKTSISNALKGYLFVLLLRTWCELDDWSKDSCLETALSGRSLLISLGSLGQDYYHTTLDIEKWFCVF